MGEVLTNGMVFTGAVALGVFVLGFLSYAFDRRIFTANGFGAVKIVPGTRTAHEFTYAPVVRQAAPAVVNVYSRKILADRSPIFEDPFFRRFFGGGEGQQRERVQHALGSGVILRPDGIIVTNNHVVAEADELLVALADRREFEARVVLSDERTDLAVLKIDPHGSRLPTVQFRDSDSAEVGDIVLAIGNPFGVGQTVTSGIISALARTQVGVSDFRFFIQTDAAINPGNSGGALVTLDGKLIGINTAIFTRTGGSIGIGFAIPSNMVKHVVESAVSLGTISRPWLGAQGRAVTAELAQSLGLERPGGVLVEEVYPGGPADRAGIKPGDVIQFIDGFEVQDPQGLRYRVATQPVGKSVRIDFVRQGEKRSATVKLTRPPEDPPRAVETLSGDMPLAGATVGSLSPAFAEELGLEGWYRGVVVLQVEEHTRAAQLRLRPADIITAVDGNAVDTVAALKRAFSGEQTQWQLTLRRGAQSFTVTLRA
jgi:serine protease Do